MAVAHDCNNECPRCCEETTEELDARVERLTRVRSLTLANILCVFCFGAHVWFAWHGKVLEIPSAFYAVILSPYGGAAFAKLWNRGKK